MSVQALCCECGILRTFPSTRPLRINEVHASGEAGIFALNGRFNRCVMQRKCTQCEKVTAQAYLRWDNGHRDSLEEHHLRRCLQGDTSLGSYYCVYCQSGVEEWAQDLERREQGQR